jgi:predicted ribonuclease YlaK
MLVIADTSPLHYLVLIEHPAILPTLFERLLIPLAVVEELQRPRTQVPVRAWMASPPARLVPHLTAALTRLQTEWATPLHPDAILAVCQEAG